MSEHSLSKEVVLLILPHVLRQDPNMYALAESISGVLDEKKEQLNLLQLYQRIDELDEDLLDILAYDFKIDWWSGNYPIEVKRNLLETNWQVHRTLGTKGAIMTALHTIYENVRVIEWYEYDGNPYCFKIVIDMTDDDTIQWEAVKNTVMMYKRESAHLDGTFYSMSAEQDMTVYVGTERSGYYGACTQLLDQIKQKQITSTAYVGEAYAMLHGRMSAQLPEIKYPTVSVAGYAGAAAGASFETETIKIGGTIG